MGHIPYGYKIKNGKAVLDTVKAKQIQILFEEYVSGRAIQEAGNKAGIERTHATLGRMLDRRLYMGDDFYPAIVSEELWNKAYEIRQLKAMALGRDKNYFSKDGSGRSPFLGKIFCSKCGSEYRRYWEHRKERWICSRRASDGVSYCDGPTFSENRLEDALIKMVAQIDISDVQSKPDKTDIQIRKKFDDPFKQAEYAYSQTTIDDFKYQTGKLIAALQNIPTEFDGEFMANIIKRIEVVSSGTLTFVLINDKQYGEESKWSNL